MSPPRRRRGDERGGTRNGAGGRADGGSRADDAALARWWEDGSEGRPLPVAGGIRASTRKGPIGATWWSRRFLASLEAVMAGGRMERGRSYARKGQVLELEVRPGVVEGLVQGSREAPYRVELSMPVVGDAEWERIVQALADRAGHAARMLAGDLPHELEDVFAAEGESLFPAPHARLTTACTCPDWENPCKHVAAVCCLLAEQFDREPFSLLAWRGRVRDELLGALRACRGEERAQPRASHAPAAPPAPAASPAPPAPAAPPAPPAPPAPAAPAAPPAPAAPRGATGASTGAVPSDELLARFWDAGHELTEVKVRPRASSTAGAVLRLAPRGVITVEGKDLTEALLPAYEAISAAAADRAQR